jgi:cytochrome c oxidase cbb3-type subunit 3/ubiquinol-cytochrome c reductase cytochrome c subunit
MGEELMRRPAVLGAVVAVLLLMGGCRRADGPTRFAALFEEHCAPCHGPGGWNGPAAPLANPVYQAWVDDPTLTRVVSEGVPGTAMRGFARRAGGPLDDAEIALLVRGMRAQWASPFPDRDRLPPYATTYGADVTDETQNGAAVYVGRCMHCHEPPGGIIAAVYPGTIRDFNYIALVSDQAIRTAVVAGRPDFGMPDWRGDKPGMELTPAQLNQLIAFFKLFRPKGATPGVMP